MLALGPQPLGSAIVIAKQARGPCSFRLPCKHADRVARVHQKNQSTARRRPNACLTPIEKSGFMTKTNPHIGSTFETWLDEAGIREEVTAAAVKSGIAAQIGDEMRKQPMTKARMAEMMKTSRAQVDRLLDPENGSATLETLMRAARVVGRELRLELV